MAKRVIRLFSVKQDFRRNAISSYCQLLYSNPIRGMTGYIAKELEDRKQNIPSYPV